MEYQVQQGVVMNLKQVAALAGVSVSTVSRVLNGKSYVNAETREIVMKAIRQTNYQPNALAQSLKMGRSNTICLMIPSIENMMFPKLTRGVEDIARKNGLTVFLCNTDEDAAVEKAYIETMKMRWIDGFIVCSIASDAPHIRSLRTEGYPLVLVNRFEASDIGKVDTVAADNYQIGYDATQYLIRTGHKRIAIAYGRDELLLYRERRRGYLQALTDNGLPCPEAYTMRETNGNNGFYYQTKELMGLDNPPDAIFCSSDPKAFVVMHALHDLGLRIPEDVAVIGVDNVSMASMVEPPLTTISQHLYRMGAAAANSLIRQIEYKEKNGVLPKPERTIFSSDLIVRRSTN